MTGNRNGESGRRARSVLGVALLSFVVCGLFFPILITGIAQVALPYQANGEIVRLDGRPVGSALIGQMAAQPVFFQPRNDSASGVDPDITVQDAYSQVTRISAATGISTASLKQVVDQSVDPVSRLFGEPYVSVLTLNLALIKNYPGVYGTFG